MTKPAFTQRDVEKAVAGAQAAGLEVGRVEIDRVSGRIVILPAGAVAVQGDALDEELREWRAGHGED
jgi:CO dehydrogenase/acetyl-CoA synthase gamma subunit (corrinoid Fe-S protein)